MRGWVFLLLTVISGLFWWRYSGRQTEPRNESAEVSTRPSPPQRRTASAEEKSAAAGSHPAATAIQSVAEFERQYPGQWRFRRRPDNSIQVITGGMIEGAGKSAENALQFAKTIAPLLAAGDYELEAQVREPAANQKMNTYDVRQFAAGYAVYQGSLQMLSRKTDGAVYIINNRLRDITDFPTSPQLTVGEGLQILRQKYGDATITSPTSPQVFALKGQPSQLAWIYAVNQASPRASQKDVAVSAVDGRILYEEERLIHD